jgi:hypothetical protein
MKLTHFSQEKHRGVELHCDDCNAPFPKWYRRCEDEEEYPGSCICVACATTMLLNTGFVTVEGAFLLVEGQTSLRDFE